MKKNRLFLSILLTTSFLLPFSSFAKKGEEKSPIPEKELTVGVVQKEIRKGMSQAEVAESLGSPNIVTKDEEGQETWIYDKIASQVEYKNKSRNFWATLILIGVQSSKDSSKLSSSQKTLTVILKFDKGSKVSSFSYHATKF